MLFSLGVMIFFGLAAGALFGKLGLPRIIGMLAAGIAAGPYALGLLDSSVLGISASFGWARRSCFLCWWGRQ